MIEIDLVRFISILEVQATAEAPTEEVTEEIVAEDNGRASSRNFEDFEDQDDGANPIEIEKTEQVPVVEEQAEVPACEEPVTEVAAVEVEAPVVEAEVEPVVEAEPTVEAITEDVSEAVVIAEPVSEEPIAETAVEVTEEPVAEAVPEATEVVPEVQEEAQPADEVSAETEAAVGGEEAISELQVQIGNYSRIAAKSTEDLILSYERAAKSIIEFIRAKKYAFGFKGDTDRKVAIWLQERVYSRFIISNGIKLRGSVSKLEKGC